MVPRIKGLLNPNIPSHTILCRTSAGRNRETTVTTRYALNTNNSGGQEGFQRSENRISANFLKNSQRARLETWLYTSYHHNIINKVYVFVQMCLGLPQFALLQLTAWSFYIYQVCLRTCSSFSSLWCSFTLKPRASRTRVDVFSRSLLTGTRSLLTCSSQHSSFHTRPRLHW